MPFDTGDKVPLSREHLPSELRPLEGDELIVALIEHRHGAILEAMWQLREERIRVRLVPHFAASGMTFLCELAMRELMDPNGTDAVRQALMNALQGQTMILSDASNVELAKRLRDEAPFSSPIVQGGRALLERQVLAAADESSLEFARAVVRGETPYAADDRVREQAFCRLNRDPEVFCDTVRELSEAWLARADADLWKDACRAAALVAGHDQCEEESRVLAEVVVSGSPSFSASERLDPPVVAFVQTHGLDHLEHSIEGAQLPDTPGSRALLWAIEELSNDRRRVTLFVVACSCQARTYGAILRRMASNWSAIEWNRRLRRLARSGRTIPRGVLQSLLQQAPATAMAESVLMVIAHPCAKDDAPLTGDAAAIISRWLKEEATDDSEQMQVLSGGFPWPKRLTAEEGARIVELLRMVCSGREWEVIVPALRSSKLSAAIAVDLLLPKQYDEVLRALMRSKERLALCRALVEYDEATVCQVVAKMHEASLSLDLCEACAPVCPDAAFQGGEKAWAGMDESDKDDYCRLLCAFGTAEQLPLLVDIVADSKQRNTDRRRKATAVIAQLTSTGKDLPSPVLELLDTGVTSLAESAVSAIATVCPETAGTLRKLRQAVANTGTLAASAQGAFSAAEDHLLSLLENELDTDARAHLLEAIGVCGSERGVQRLLDHVGPTAVDTHLTARKAAAQALSEVVLYEELSVPALQRLALLLDGDECEKHSEVRLLLSQASLRARMGEDAALEELYKLADFTPRRAADALFGNEKESLVRQVTLLAQEEKRGPAGWGAWLALLDTVAELLVRASYVRVGTSESLRKRVRQNVRGEPSYGELLQALSSVPSLARIRSLLETVHALRCDSSEITHPGATPSEDTVTTARTAFQKAARQILGLLAQS